MKTQLKEHCGSDGIAILSNQGDQRPRRANLRRIALYPGLSGLFATTAFLILAAESIGGFNPDRSGNPVKEHQLSRNT